MITAVVLVDLLAVVLVGLALCTVLRRPGTPGLLRAGAIVVWLVSALSLALVGTAPWGKGGCAENVYTLMTSEFDYGEGGAPPGCRDPEGQAALAVRLELGVLGAAALVGAGYGLVLAREPR